LFFQSEVKLFTKAPNDKTYKPTSFRQKLNYCMMTRNPNMPNFMLMFLPKAMEKFLPLCPLSGKYLFNFTVSPLPVDLTIFPQGDYRVNTVFSTEDQVVVSRTTVYMQVQLE
jgi:hypothetical protein